MGDTADIDDALRELWPIVVTQQNQYFAQHGRYCQVLWTHSQAPVAPTAPDNLDARPYYQDPQSIYGLPPLMRSRMRIDQYGPADGKPHGWVMHLETTENGSVMSQSVDCGVRPELTVVWHPASPAP